jgi:hypothetical protein
MAATASFAVNPPANNPNPGPGQQPPVQVLPDSPPDEHPVRPGWDSSSRVGMPTDWSNRHVLYTNGGTPRQHAAAMRDPRAWGNWLQRTFHPGAARGRVGPDASIPRPPLFPVKRRGANLNSHIDWAVSLGGTAGMPIGETPAKYTFDVTAAPSCANDFVVFVINAAPSVGGQANIVALNNLYSGTTPSTGICGSGSATFMWAYASGTGAVFLSPTLSLDGKKVAYIEQAGSGRAVFHVLTWKAGQGTNATTGAVAPGNGSTDVTLDFTNITTAGCTASGAAAGNASPYIDYTNDAAYVADASGRLYHIKGVFNGTPTMDFCTTVSAGQSLTSPVYDNNTNKVFVSDGQSVFAYTVGAGSFTATVPASVTVSGTAATIVLSPILDSTNGFLYVFSQSNNARNHSIVSQMPLSLATHTDVNIGANATGFASVLDGTFDNGYFASGPSQGTLYACGMQAGNGNKPALYAMSFQANGTINTTPVMNGNINVNNAANSNGSCSPLTEFFDGTNDRLFVGAGANNGNGGANMVTMWNINPRPLNQQPPITPLTTASTPNATAVNEIGGTSGITVDNNSGQAQASSIYFGTLQKSAASPCGASLFCAVKLTQGGLQ